jgi:hypothetical protein
MRSRVGLALVLWGCVTLAAAGAVGHSTGAAAGSEITGCQIPGITNLTGTWYYWVSYSNTTGAITALSVGNGGTVGPPSINLSSNATLVNEIWCDDAAGHLSYWHVDLTTGLLVRNPTHGATPSPSPFAFLAALRTPVGYLAMGAVIGVVGGIAGTLAVQRGRRRDGGPPP